MTRNSACVHHKHPVADLRPRKQPAAQPIKYNSSTPMQPEAPPRRPLPPPRRRAAADPPPQQLQQPLVG